MLRLGWRTSDLRLPRGVRWNSRVLKAAQTVGEDLPKDAISEVERIYQLVGRVTAGDLARQGSQDLLKLGQLIDSIQNGRDMRKVRNKLQRRYGFSYNTVFCSLRDVVTDPSLFKMSMFRRPGVKQYQSFVTGLKSVINDRNLSYEQKKKNLYRIISYQHELFPEASKRGGYLVPTEVHKWFWDNLPKAESFNHFYFLIKNDVLLSSCPYVWRFAKRLMQGSEIEKQLATFEIFLHDKAHQEIFQQKFEKLYSFYAVNKLVNKVLSGKDFRYIKIYLSSLLHMMESMKASGDNQNSKKKRMLSVQFNNTLLYYLSQTGDVEMFLKTFRIKLQYMLKAGLLKDFTFTREYLHRSLQFTLRLLRQKGLHEQVFQFIRIIQRASRGKTAQFNRHVAGELISSLRSFNDPKLSCQYILSAFKTTQTAKLLNNLGLWAPIFHQDQIKLSDERLEAEVKAQDHVFPRSLTVNTIPSIPVMTELYRVLLSTCAKTMGRETYQDLILNLYSAYKKAIEQRMFPSSKHDTGILSVFLYHIRLELNNKKLALEILTDFYSQEFAASIKCTSKACPFSWVVYKNHELSQAEISHLLHLMEVNKVPLQFYFCTAMVLRYLNFDNVEEAYSWYKKILHAGFEVNHSLLIKAIKENGWEYPKNFDMSLLDKIDDRSTYSREDALFLEENNELDDTQASIENDANSLLKVITLVEESRPSNPQRSSI